MNTKTRTRRALQPLWNAFDDVAVSILSTSAATPASRGPPSAADVAGDLAAGCVLAVSGGPDSRALLEAFATWPARSSAARILVVTVDHQRRSGSANEALAVGVRCRELGLEHAIAVVAPAAGDEQTLRRARYAALIEQAKKSGVDVVVTAHHRGDVAEGLLMHLAGRGGGRGGRAPHVVERRQEIRFVRPFLDVPKETLGAALQALEIHDVVVDEDDAAGRNARALIRLRILAPLQEQRADVEAALARHARHRTEDDDVLEALIPADDVVDAGLPPALLRRWLLRQVAALVEDPRTSPAAVDDVLRLCARGQVGRVDLRGSHAEIRRERGRGLVVAVVVGAGQSDRR
ncbi:MAG: tRNA lysidine(34) synthetase TilS [Deltaproteobacteria bacterium]|nr:tRNA lysidine(34) synthetase TilS [Deltaproteobacteria bacterium]